MFVGNHQGQFWDGEGGMTDSMSHGHNCRDF